MWGLFFPPAASHPQRRVGFHRRLGRMGRGWSAVWRAAGHPVWRPGQRTPQILHCLRALHCPGSWQKAIKGQARADYIPEQRLATSQQYGAHIWGKESHPFHCPERLWLSQLFLLPSGDQVRPIQVPGTMQTLGSLGSGLHKDHPGMQSLLAWSGGSGGSSSCQMHWGQWRERAVRDLEGLQRKQNAVL